MVGRLLLLLKHEALLEVRVRLVSAHSEVWQEKQKMESHVHVHVCTVCIYV